MMSNERSYTSSYKIIVNSNVTPFKTVISSICSHSRFLKPMAIVFNHSNFQLPRPSQLHQSQLVTKSSTKYKSNLPAVCLSWWPSCFDRGALINVDVPGCAHRWFEARQGTGRKVFILGYSCIQRFPRCKCLLLFSYISH